MRIIRTNRPASQTELSSQRRWQIRQVREGRCAQCGAPREHYALVCDACAEKQRVAKRLRHGFKPQRKGRRGRPPLAESHA
ncbi:MAG TPA: hypothetical protein VL754_21460 [Verrucomicrobiae bacterium]|jgi:predicted amidophosphoribosyltransferase|nr:hypothetical protein [Verrucomicrobiae bacterium]